MTQEKLIDAITDLDSDILDRYFDMKADLAAKKKPKKRTWVKWASVAACFALLVSASLWLFVPGLGTYEQVEISTSIKLGDDYVASYSQVKDMSNFDRLTLESKIGDLYLETETQKLYKLKGHDDIAQLIAVTNKGDTHLFRFSEMNYWEKGAEPFSFGFLLVNIFNVKNAEDIKSVKFEKAISSNKDYYKMVKVNTVTVTDNEQIEKLFDVFGALIDTEITFSEHIDHHSERYLNGTLPLSIQTQRKVTMEFENGTSVELLFDPYYKQLRWKGPNYFEGFAEEDLNWLIEIADINMDHVDYGTVFDEFNEGGGEVTDRPGPAN